MSNKIYKTGRFIGTQWIAWNSVSVVDWDFVSKVWGYIVASTAGVDIEWVAAWAQTFTSDNQTVAKKKLQYIEADAYMEFKCEISWGTITQVDEWKYYDLADKDTVDGATESATTGQLKLVKFVSSTVGIFTVANK